MNDKQLEQLSERVREAKGAVDEGDSKRGMTLMKKVFGEMARRTSMASATPPGSPSTPSSLPRNSARPGGRWQVESARLAVTFHNVEDRRGEDAARCTTDPAAALAVFRVLKDADALDRVRFGRNRLDLRQLRFEESHPMVAKAAELVRSGES